MLTICIISSLEKLAEEFERCCNQYRNLHIASAWSGNPEHVLPYSFVESVGGTITVTLGTSFSHTHPDAIKFFIERRADLRLFREDVGLFHPKVYLFEKGNKVATFIGSSNLTFSGFFENVEVNVLLEGIPNSYENKQLNHLKHQLKNWHSDRYSFVPSQKWLETYRKAFAKNVKKQRSQGIITPSRLDADIASSSWLRHAKWNIYYNKIIEGLKRRKRNMREYIYVLNAAQEHVPLPWQISYFDKLENRRIIGGMGEYGWLGHVAASGSFRHLLANGSRQEHRIITSVINQIGSMSPPIDWKRFETLLSKLLNLGPTIKVWSRLFCIVRPDLYCTVASTSVRRNLAQTLGLPQERFVSPAGYIQLHKLIHASPWYNSARPKERKEIDIWRRRVAFMDSIFY